jgi:hypothetical protein
MHRLFSSSRAAAIFAIPRGWRDIFFFFLPFLIEKSTPVRAWGSSAGDGAVRPTLAESRGLGGAPGFPR